MKESERLGLIARIIQKLNEAGSWTGRTHIQKDIYLAQELLALPSDYPFVLYQRGPYSFDLDSHIRSLRAIGAIDLELMPAPYGPRYCVTQFGRAISQLHPLDADLDQALTSLAQTLGNKTARDLELLGTAHYVLTEGDAPDEDRISRLVRLKPHFSAEQAKAALEEVRNLEKWFKST